MSVWISWKQLQATVQLQVSSAIVVYKLWVNYMPTHWESCFVFVFFQAGASLTADAHAYTRSLVVIEYRHIHARSIGGNRNSLGSSIQFSFLDPVRQWHLHAVEFATIIYQNGSHQITSVECQRTELTWHWSEFTPTRKLSFKISFYLYFSTKRALRHSKFRIFVCCFILFLLISCLA